MSASPHETMSGSLIDLCSYLLSAEEEEHSWLRLWSKLLVNADVLLEGHNVHTRS